ncbi:hypothetical protein VIBNISOn1_1370006 [Vibrio nigripulchritudo SOn1]|uniref:DUF6701 domain-containing protein n=1 Tax=Vibrio nigripulchritudo SOn1 TaxID=1238450 RepID=A0AAV2VK97_9VIBR|nr:DUF6701 domain-containing protein [Vibrio nigripulchritudo]CCO45101.1 hypothetical protein VIBNISOn1_1370006 [Vibrio nigripulchritudo SOn1]
MKLFRFALTLLLLFMGAGANALELEYGRYNVNAYPHPDCINTVCQVNFEKTYNTVPMVFFMSTISFLNEQDSPSAIKVLEVTNTYVRFKQKIAPDRRAPSSNEDVPMKVIDYVVMEKGIHDFNGVKVIVDEISTQKYMYRLGTNSAGNVNRNKRERIYFNNYSNQGFNSFSGTPGIIHQVQSINNGEDFWLTSTVPVVNRNYFDIALERSEIDGYKSKNSRLYPTQPERIGFIAAYGSGERDDIKFAVKNQITINSYDTGDPVTTGCETYADYDENYDVVPIIVASKNTRYGNNGGWLRRCRLETGKSSFMVEEDQDADSERKHIAERLGYIIFEVPFDVEQCIQFTGPAQTWDTSGQITMVGSSKISGAVNGNQLGYFNVNTHLNNSCTSGNCIANNSLLVPNYNFAAFTPGATSINLNNGTHSVSPGQYDEINISGSAVVTLTAGDYFANEINITGNAEVKVSGQVYLHSKGTVVANSGRVNLSGVPNDIYFVVHGDSSLFRMYGNVDVTAFVIAENNISIEGSSKLTGAMASLTASMSGNTRLNGDISSCNQPVYQLQITPQSATELVGNSIPITFNLINSEGNVDNDFYGNLIITPETSTPPCWKATDQASAACIADTSTMPIQGGTATYYLYSDTVVEVATVTATVVNFPSITASAGPYNFNNTGFIFEPSPLKIIAGQQTNVTIKATRETSGSGTETMDDYDGTKTLQFTPTSHIVPSSGTLQAVLVNSNVVFTDGVGTMTLRYNDAGQINVTVRDDANDIEGVMVVEARPDRLALCDVAVGGVTKSHDGTATSGPGFARAGESFSVRIKPVIFDNTVANDCSRATTPNFHTESGHFAQANLGYSLHSPSGGSAGTLTHENTDITGTVYEFKTSANARDGILANLNWNEVGSINLTATSLAYDYGETSGIDSDTIQVGRFYPYQFELTQNYTQEGQAPNPTYQTAGFTYMEQNFKSEFEVTAQGRNLVPNSDPAQYTFTTATNYGGFAESVAMQLNLVALNNAIDPASANNDLTNRLITGNIANANWFKDWSDGTASIPSTVFEFARLTSQVTPRITQPDGPYEVRLGLEASEHSMNCSVVGCTNFVDAVQIRNDGSTIYNGRKFTASLDMRYGRLALDDVGTNSGQNVTVPVRAEYWNGSKFVANTDDVETDFDGANYCRQLVWPAGGSTSADLTGSHTNIDNGTSSNLIARQNATVEGTREQVRLKLRIGVPAAGETGLSCAGNNAQELEFLHFNWLGEGDDNPSAIVTFGVYRGNDRVIFRGEPRIY